MMASVKAVAVSWAACATASAAGANAAAQLALLEQAMHALSIYDDAWAVALQRI